MFGSAILDVVAGVVFAFLGVSLAASAITEAFGSWLQLRQATLVKGMKDLLNDQGFNGLARDLLNHALVNPLSNGAASTVATLTARPAYIDPTNFAMALTDILRTAEATRAAARAPTAQAAALPAATAQVQAAGISLGNAIAGMPEGQIKQTLLALLTQAGNEEAAFTKQLGAWFDSSMARVSGEYKRKTQWVSFLAALAVAFLLNIDALHVSTTLWRQPSLAGALGASITAGAKAQSPPGTPPAPDLASAKKVLEELDKSTLIGWNGVSASDLNPTTLNGLKNALSMLLGWFIVAGASLFGAPFWFDTLQKITQLRGVGGGAGPQQRTSDHPQV